MFHKLVLDYCVYNAVARKGYNTKLDKTTVNFQVGYKKQIFQNAQQLSSIKNTNRGTGSLDSPRPDCSRFRVIRADALKGFFEP